MVFTEGSQRSLLDTPPPAGRTGSLRWPSGPSSDGSSSGSVIGLDAPAGNTHLFDNESHELLATVEVESVDTRRGGPDGVPKFVEVKW
jgi:hypothetical protein